MCRKCPAIASAAALAVQRRQRGLPTNPAAHALTATPQGHVSHAQRQTKMIEREKIFNAPDFVPRMINVLNIVRSEWFRWFDSGTYQT